MIKKTPLYDNHVAHGGKMVEFGGYLLPLQYEGIVAEHNATRKTGGLFDVSHMGEIVIKGARSVELVDTLITNDAKTMHDGQVKYTLMLNERGTIVDDMLVYRYNNNHFMLVPNASNTDKVMNWIKKNMISEVEVENISEICGLLALQGRVAETVLQKLGILVPPKYYTFYTQKFMGREIVVSRTGYTGEDGFELYIYKDDIAAVYEKLLSAGKEYGVVPCGLGARDTLRFESCLPLYGHELCEDYYGNEVALNIFIKTEKFFIGRDALPANPLYMRKGVKLLDKGIAREGAAVYEGDRQIGIVTSGTLSPTLGTALAMVRIERSFKGENLEIDVRGKRLKAEIMKMPFFKRDY